MCCCICCINQKRTIGFNVVNQFGVPVHGTFAFVILSLKAILDLFRIQGDSEVILTASAYLTNHVLYLFESSKMLVKESTFDPPLCKYAEHEFINVSMSNLPKL